MIDVHRVTSDWTEGTGPCVGTTDMASNWNQRTSGTNWTTAGGDYNATVEASVASSANGSTTTWNIQSLIQGWVSATYPNYGLMIKEADESAYNQMTFATREYTGTTNDARLVITYSDIYYSKGSLSVNTPSNWNTQRDGTGTNASSFGTGNKWVIQNTHAMTLTGATAWNVSASGIVQIESGGTWTNTSSGTVTIGAFQVDNGGTYAHGTTAAFPGTTRMLGATSTVNYSGTNQTVTALSYGHLTLSNSGTKTLAGTITPSGDLTVSGGTFDLGTYTANRASAGGTLTVSNGATLKIGGTGGFPSNYTTNTLGSTSTVEYNGTGAQTVGAQNYGYLIISGARTTNNVTLANSGTIGIASTFTNSATFTSGAYVITGSTMDFNGGSQNVGFFTYNHLTFSGSGTKAATGSITVNGTLTIGNGIVFAPSGLSHTVKGDFINNGVFTASTSTMTFSGSSLQNIGGSASTTFNNLTVTTQAASHSARTPLSVER